VHEKKTYEMIYRITTEAWAKDNYRKEVFKKQMQIGMC